MRDQVTVKEVGDFQTLKSIKERELLFDHTVSMLTSLGCKIWSSRTSTIHGRIIEFEAGKHELKLIRSWISTKKKLVPQPEQFQLHIAMDRIL